MLTQTLRIQSPDHPPHSPPCLSLSAPLPILRPEEVVGGSAEGRSGAHLAQPWHNTVPLILSGITHAEHCLICQQRALSLGRQTVPWADSGQGKEGQARWVLVRRLSGQRTCHQPGFAGAPPQPPWPHSPPPYTEAVKGRRNQLSSPLAI